MAEPALRPEAGHHRPTVENASRFAPFAEVQADGLAHLTLAVEGVNCANCIQKIESALTRDPAVKQARVNFSTKRLTLVWDGAPAQAEVYGQLVESLGYRAQPFGNARSRSAEEEESRFLLRCMAVAGFASGNIMLLSFALWSTTLAEMGLATRELMHWVSGLIAIPTALYSGRPFFRSAWAALTKGRTNMDVPISVGVVLTLLMSIFETLRGAEHAYFDAVVMLLFFLLIGRYLDVLARNKARAAASDLLALMAGRSTIEEADGSTRVIAIRDLREGMVVLLAMGERVPADAIVLQGTSSMDTSLVTGESLPQTVKPGDSLYSGMLNLEAPLRLQVAKAAENSLLADIVRLMEKAEQGQARYVRIADRAARYYTPVVHLAALLTFLAWVFIGGMAWQPALMIAVTVLIITCPCALGLAVPVVQVLATSTLLKRGIMVKAGDAFERLAAIDTLLLDKTGTLTLGHPALANGADLRAEDFTLAARMARQSRHPLSAALAAAYAGPLSPLEVREHPGEGLEATDNGETVRLGSRRWIGATGPEDGQLELWLARGNAAPVRFVFNDPLRTDTVPTIARLKAMGLRLLMLSGDRPEAVAQVARTLGLDEAVGALKPQDKYARLEALRKEGHKICMVGDGLNDAPVLAGADVSISPASAIDMAQNAADIVFMGDKLAPVADVIRVARFTQKLVRQNFVMAIGYNIVAVPLAMAGYVTPLIAALAMSGSSIAVIANAFRLKRSA